MPIKSIKISAEEIVRTKLAETFRVLHGYVQESKGDIETNGMYTAKGVHARMQKILEALNSDVEILASDIELDEE